MIESDVEEPIVVVGSILLIEEVTTVMVLLLPLRSRGLSSEELDATMATAAD